jgi:pimeloyl-ACP methyl ester carboxylesterase
MSDVGEIGSGAIATSPGTQFKPKYPSPANPPPDSPPALQVASRQCEDVTSIAPGADRCIRKSAGLERFALFGLSQGVAVAIAYASRHPERLTHLILYGGFARGLLYRENPEKAKQTLELTCALVREGWGSDQDSYREFFTSQFFPDGTIDHHRWLNNVQRITAAPEIAEQVMCTNAGMNVVDLLPKVRVPTLVMHARGDIRVPFSQGQEIAAGVPGAKFVPLESRNHLILADEPANRQFFDAVASFLGDRRIRGTLPGTATFKERAQRSIAAIERNWLIKTVAILAALAAATVSFVQLYRLLQN